MTEGGIALPDQSIESLPMGPVKSVSPDIDAVSVGDVVMFNALGAVPVAIGKETFVLIELDDVLMVMEEGEYNAS